MKKLVEHTYGLSAFMRMELDGKQEEVSVYWRNDGEHYSTTADDNPERREKIIDAFHALY